MVNLSLNKLKLISKSRCIEGYISMSKERLLSVLNESESVESEKNFDDARITKIKDDFNELRDLYEIENKNNLLTQKIKRDWRKSSRIRRKSF